MCVDYDPPDVFRVNDRTAAKQHRCIECGRTIEPGETYRYAVGLSEGWWWKAKQCAQCAQASRWLSVVCSGFLYEDVLHELEDHVHEPYPIATVQLAKLVVLMRRNWQRNGALVPADDVCALVDRAVAPFRERVAA